MLFFDCYGDHHDRHVMTHSFPSRRSSDLGSDDKGFVGGSGQQADAADEDSKRLPRLREGDKPAKKGVDAEQHFTQPPPRFSEASLVKRLEELGIGRPSTYEIGRAHV